VPIIFLRKIILFYSFFYSGLLLLLSTLILFYRRTLFFTLVFSSVLHRIWISLRVFVSKRMRILYWIYYSIVFSFLVGLFSKIKLDQSTLTQRAFLRVCWLLISGIPPFIMFWVKVYVVIWFIYLIGLSSRYLIVFTRTIALTSYFRAWHLGRLKELRIIQIRFLGPVIITILFWIFF